MSLLVCVSLRGTGGAEGGRSGGGDDDGGGGGIEKDVGTASLNISHSYKKQQAHIQKGVQLCFSRVVKAVGGACHSGA